MKNLVKKSVIMLFVLSGLFLSSCTEEIIEPEVPVAKLTEGDDPEPEPEGGPEGS